MHHKLNLISYSYINWEIIGLVNCGKTDIHTHTPINLWLNLEVISIETHIDPFEYDDDDDRIVICEILYCLLTEKKTSYNQNELA